MRAHRLLGIAFAALTLSASAGYLFIYLYRWEWNRALIAGVIFLATEVGVVGWMLHDRLSALRQRVDRLDQRRVRIEDHLGAARGEPRPPFAWLGADGSRLSVFVPILLGTGLVLSALAWVIDRIGRATAGRVSDHRLSDDLSRLGPPPGGFLDDPADPLRLLRRPVRRSR